MYEGFFNGSKVCVEKVCIYLNGDLQKVKVHLSYPFPRSDPLRDLCPTDVLPGGHHMAALKSHQHCPLPWLHPRFSPTCLSLDVGWEFDRVHQQTPREKLACSYRFLPTSQSLSLPSLSLVSSDTIFAHIFCPFLTQLHIPYPTFLLYVCPYYAFTPYAFTLTNRRQEHDLIGTLVTEQLVYWATNILKQSCCGSSSSRSCTGTSSTTTECSHHSKFRTSQTRSTSRSASTA